MAEQLKQVGSSPTMSDRIVTSLLGYSDEGNSARERDSLEGKRDYLFVYSYFRENVGKLPADSLPDIKISWSRVMDKQRVREENAALHFTTQYWLRRLSPDLLNEEDVHPALLEHHDKVASRLAELKPTVELKRSEISEIHRSTRRILKVGSDDQREVLFGVAKFTPDERLTFIEKSVESLKLMTKWEAKAEGLALIAGLVGMIPAQILLGDASWGLTFLGGNIPSWLAVGPMAIATAVMAEKTGICPNVFASLTHSLFKHSPAKTRVASAAVPVLLWEVGVKDVAYNFLAASDKIIDSIPIVNQYLSGTFPQWFFIINGAIVTSGYLYRTYWCWQQSRLITPDLEK